MVFKLYFSIGECLFESCKIQILTASGQMNMSVLGLQAAADWMLPHCSTSVSSCGQLGTTSEDIGQEDPVCSDCTVSLSEI